MGGVQQSCHEEAEKSAGFKKCETDKKVHEEAERVEESSEWVVLHIYRLHLRVLYVFNMYYCRQRLLGSIG